MNPHISCRLSDVKCVLSVIMIFFAGCSASSRLQSIEADYRDRRESEIGLMVMPLSNEFMSKDMQSRLSQEQIDTRNMLTQQELSYFNTYMGLALSRKTTAVVMRTDPSFKPTNIEFSYKELLVNNRGSLKMFGPNSGKVKYLGIVPGYVLFLEDLSFRKGYQVTRSELQGGKQERYPVTASIKYLIWDNNEQKIAAYGKLTQEFHTLMSVPSKEYYLWIFDKFASLIIQNSPFGRKY